MMNPAPVFDRVYGGLKQLLRQGAITPGTRLDPAGYAVQLSASVTPVRDALHRLAGETMLVSTNDGFQVPILSEPDLRDLYDWIYQLLMLALRTSNRINAGFLLSRPTDAEPATVFEQLFDAIAASSCNRELRRAVAAAGDRLHAAQRVEPLALPGIETELEELIDADLRRLRTLLGRYRRRRVASVPAILRALYRSSK